MPSKIQSTTLTPSIVTTGQSFIVRVNMVFYRIEWNDLGADTFDSIGSRTWSDVDNGQTFSGLEAEHTIWNDVGSETWYRFEAVNGG